jgi:hypothetical protein
MIAAMAPKEKRSEWKFRTAEDRSWLWHVRRPDGSEDISDRRFLRLKDCIADARQRGYVLWLPDADRRRSTH